MNPPTPPETYPQYVSSDAERPREPEAAPSDRSAGRGDVDASLVQRMKDGDERALGELYDRWSARVHALAMAMLRDAGEAEDVTEETFWQAWRQSSRFDATRGTSSAWLLTIARSRALDRLRARRRRPEDPIADTTIDLAADTSSPAEAAELGERGHAVRGALRELPREQQEALTLAYFGGLSQSEIAERTGQPLGTVKTRMRLGLARLRKTLAALGEVPA